MDPVSAAGLGLSRLLEHQPQVELITLEGYQMFLEMKEMPSRYEHLRTRMRLEQSRCLRWGEKVGLAAELLDKPSKVLHLNHNLVLDVLLQLQKSFRSCLDITIKYDTRPQALPGKTSTDLDSIRSSFLRKTLTVWERAGHVVGRVEWAMIRKDGFEALIKQLIQFNDSIESLLDRDTLEELRTVQAQSHLALLQMTEQVTQLNDLVRALQVVVVPDQDANWGNIPRSSALVQPEDQTMIMLAVFKSRHPIPSSLEHGTQVAPQLRIDIDGLQLGRTLQSGRQLGALNGHHVWLEWQHRNTDIDPRSSYNAVLDARIGDLAAILADQDKPAAFSSPRCLGYTRSTKGHNSELALVFERPEHSEEDDSGPLSLRGMVSNDAGVSLNARFELACTLAESLMYLHAVNWVHKGISSENVLFHPGPDRRLKFYEPVLSGFEHARPALPEELTLPNDSTPERDFYRHPELLGLNPGRSRKSHDIYSLGLLLTEIALWRPIEKIVSLELRKSKAILVRPRMLDPNLHVFQLVAEAAGRTYADVVRTCITGGSSIGLSEGADEEDATIGALLLRNMHQKVVVPLKGLKI
ncbi:hypothetical protein LTS10_001741 [Elasticomyces elasticus]|nr:hypothetical protein LTS10_001741 [Elasticomyces elasticus]